VADLGDTGDSSVLYTLTWTSASTEILIEMAGHLAKGGTDADAWGPGQGVSSVQGGPSHFSMRQLDGSSTGGQDNAISATGVMPVQTETPTPTATSTSTPTPTSTPTLTATPAATPTATATQTGTPPATATPTSTATATPVGTATPTPSPTATAVPGVPTATATPVSVSANVPTLSTEMLVFLALVLAGVGLLLGRRA
jgi:hypothetical protein